MSSASAAALPDAREPLIAVKDLRTTFQTMRGAVRAVDGVSLSVAPGERLGIVGESGSGKTVLVRSLMNLFEGDHNATVEGEIRFQGRDVRTMPKDERRHFWGREIAMVFQDPMTSLNPVKRIGAQIAEPMRFHLGLDRKQAQERATELLDRLRIPEARSRLRQYPHELSGGMRQRVALAIALSCSPKLLIADEPTTALDVTVQKQILDLIDGLATDLEMSVILITHDLGVAAGRTDRVAVMYAGRVAELATPIELFDHLRHPYSEALLRSSPRLDQPSHTRLQAIGGRAPDLVSPPPGCRFAPRCPRAQDRCTVDTPALEVHGPSHWAACHFPLGTPEPAARPAPAMRPPRHPSP
jgi:peptide/nickel transport system ATP-binding protein